MTSTDGHEIPLVAEISAAETHPLRLAVLRHNVPTRVVVFPEDGLPGTVHLGVRVSGYLVAVSSWIPRPYGDVSAVQLRGMATSHDWQGAGIGGLLLHAGCARAVCGGYDMVWARARDAALKFYQRHGFVVEGNGFIDADTQLPHHVVVRRLDRSESGTALQMP